jgi:diguanylate cyclase
MSTSVTPAVVAAEQQRAVLALFVAQLKLPACRERCHLDFKAALASDLPVERVARRLSTCLADRTPNPACATLLQLVDGVSLPQNLLAEATALHEQLATAEDDTAFGHHVRRLAALIDGLPSQLQQEKDSVAQNLVTLGDRLQDIYRSISQADEVEAVAASETAALDQRVAAEVQHLEAEVDGNRDLGALGDHLHSRLEAIASQVHRYREQEQQRLAGLREQNDQLRCRVTDLENEVGRLRSGLNAQRHRIITDALTGLHNRFAYDERLVQELARWQRHRTPLSLLLCDIDHFKKVNDTLGHHAGDEVLKSVADLLASALRKTDFIARYGGEEFVVLLSGAAADRAATVAGKLRQLVAGATIDLGSTAINVTVSCGHATLADEDASGTALFERADQALYQAKRSGRNRICAG